MKQTNGSEWAAIETLLPCGWQEASRTEKAFRRKRYTQTPSEVLRLLLLHAASDTPLRETMALARAAKVSSISAVALFKRMMSASGWLAWMCRRLADELGGSSRTAGDLRLRAVDGTTVQGPAAKGIDWRLHFSIDLASLCCDWFELTDATKGEALWRVPMRKNEVLLADRYYLTTKAVGEAKRAGAFVLIRMRWNHIQLLGKDGQRVSALKLCRPLRVGQIGDWRVTVPLRDGGSCAGRIVATRLPAPVAARAERKIRGEAKRKRKQIDARSARAARYVMVFTTVPRRAASARSILEIYRARWQIELVFKRMKQLLKLGHLPHKNKLTGRTWILSKMLLSLLLEKLHRQASAFFPWGYDINQLPHAP